MSQYVSVSGPIARIPSKGMAGLQLTLVRVVSLQSPGCLPKTPLAFHILIDLRTLP